LDMHPTGILMLEITCMHACLEPLNVYDVNRKGFTLFTVI